MRDRCQALGACVTEHHDDEADSFAARARMAYKPGARRSLDVCLDASGPFIDALNVASPLNSGVPTEM
jgi:hypothetical protein